MLTFALLSLIMVAGALGVITLRQPVHAALSLVGTLLTLAITYVTLEAHFLAAVQVIVYAGAIMVLFLFVIMLLNVQYQADAQTRWLRWAAYATGLAVAVSLVLTVIQEPRSLPDTETITAALGGGGASQIADSLFSEFVLAFQLVGVLLLTGIIGAVSLVERKAALAVAAGTVVAALPANAADGLVTSQPLQATSGNEQASANDVAAKLPGQLHETAVGHVPVDDLTKIHVPVDDLTKIKGIGRQLAQLLHDNQVTTFAQIAALSEADIITLDEQLGSFKGRISRDEWVEQAQALLQERNA